MSKRKVGISFTGGLLFLIVVMAWLTYRQFNLPARGSLTAAAVQVRSAAVSFNLHPIVVTTPWANFDYPAALSPLPDQQASPPILANFAYGYQGSNNWHLAISVNSLNAASLSADSNYTLRESEPSIYQASTVTYHAKTYMIMTDKQQAGFDEVAFTLDGQRSADISLEGDDSTGQQNLQATFAMVLSSWQWH